MEKKFPRKHMKNDYEGNILLEQYKILVDSINKLHDTREFSNGFWVAANGIGVSILAYIKDAQNINTKQLSLLLIAIIVLGIILSFSWISYLSSIKKALEVRNETLVKIENCFPIPIFTTVFHLSNESNGKSELTLKEMFVPGLFLITYIFFAVLFFFYPQEVISSLKKG